MRRRISLVVSLLALTLALGGSLPADGHDEVQLPNLVPLTAWPEIDPADDSMLRFSTFIQNRGAWSFEVLGTPDQTNEELIAQQCVAWHDPAVLGAPRTCAAHREIGRLVWHSQHNHLHLDGLATYRLFRDAAGAPGELVRDAPKVGFCLTDSFRNQRHRSPVHAHPAVDPLLDDRYDLHRSQAEQWYVECRWLYGSGVPWPGMRMGISAQWQDLYNGPVPGQQFPVGDLADGTYWLQTLVNASPVVTVLETDTTDNTHWLRLCLGHDARGKRTVRDGAC